MPFIFNDDLTDFNMLVSNSFCSKCETYESTVTNYNIKLNQLYDLVLTGYCGKCGNDVGRYIETGESPKTRENAKAVWNTHQTLKQMKITKTK